MAHKRYMKLATRGSIASPPHTICVTALPCKILISTLPVFVHVYYY